MSYQVIARKWRPRAFEELVGQTHVSQTLLNALKNDRLPHALLFTGPRGTGKTSSARILAKALRCPNAKNFTPCNECDDCTDIAAGSSVNVIEIDGASNNGVEAIRELRDSVGYMPSSGKYKVYIIDEVHMLSTNAFNALLKTLEEPPEHVIFIMATTEVQKIPNTILSRCQRFDFRRIPLRLIVERLEQICTADEVKANTDALWMLARQGDGSMRDSQSLLDQVITFCDKDITLEKVIEVLGLTDRSLLVNTLESLARRDVDGILKVIDSIFKSGYDPKVFMQDLLEEVRHLLLVKLTPENIKQIIDLPDSELERLKALADELSSEDIHLIFDMALKGAHDLPRAQDTRIVLEMLLLRMSQAPRLEDLQNLSETLKKKSFSSPAPVARPHAKAVSQKSVKKAPSKTLTSEFEKAALKRVSEDKKQPEKKPENKKPEPQIIRAKAPGDELVKEWFNLIVKVTNRNSRLGAQLENTYLEKIDNNVVHIAVPPKLTFLLEQLNSNLFKGAVAENIEMYWGREYSFEVVLGEEKKAQAQTPKAIKEKRRNEHQRKVLQEVENHPLMKKTNEVFKTQIKNIKEIK